MFIVGIDAHLDTLAAAKCDGMGSVVATMTVPNSKRGWRQLWKWGRRAHLWAVEGSGAYGEAFARFLMPRGADVREVPTRLSVAERWRMGRRKADQIDAVAAARAALREDLPPVVYDPKLAALTAIVAHRRALVAEQTRTLNRLRRLLAALDPARAAAIGRIRTEKALLALRRTRLGAGDPHLEALSQLIRTHANTALRRRQEIKQATTRITQLLPPAASQLTQITGIGVIAAATLITQIKDIHRFPTPAAFTTWCGAAPLDASSGRQTHHRLNRFGNRTVNSTLHLAIITQLSQDPNHYVNRRCQQGKPKRDAIRAAKRYLARQIWTTLTKLT